MMENVYNQRDKYIFVFCGIGIGFVIAIFFFMTKIIDLSPACSTIKSIEPVKIDTLVYIKADKVIPYPRDRSALRIKSYFRPHKLFDNGKTSDTIMIQTYYYYFEPINVHYGIDTVGRLFTIDSIEQNWYELNKKTK